MKVVWVVIPLVLFGIVGIQESFASHSNDESKHDFFVRDFSDQRPGYPIYDENGELKYYLDFWKVDEFERTVYDFDTGIAFQNNLAALSSESEPQSNIINWDSKMSPSIQRDSYFVGQFLGQILPPFELDKIYYPINLEVEDLKLLSLPSYAILEMPDESGELREHWESLPDDFDQSKEVVLNLLDTRLAIKVPITKMNEVADLFDADDNVVKTIAPRKDIIKTASVGPTHIPEKYKLIIGKYNSPLKQILNGVDFTNIACNDPRQLVIKLSDNSPACVKPSTAEKLIERGWGVGPDNNKFQNLFEAKVTQIINGTTITKSYYFATQEEADYFEQIGKGNKSKLRPEGYIPYKTPKISPELQGILDSEVERVDVRIVLKNTPKPPPGFLKMTDEEQVANLQERYEQIRMMQQDLVDYITNNDGVVIKQLEFINSVYADVPVTIIDELKNRDDIFTINYYDKDTIVVSMPIHPPG